MQVAGTSHRVAVLVVARAGPVAVYAELSRLTAHVAEGAMEARVAQTLSGDYVAVSIEAVTAVVFAVLPVGAIRAADLAPVPDPAGVAVRTLAMDGVTVMSVLAGGTDLLAVFAKKTFGAELVAARPIPAAVTRDTAALCHLAGLLTFAVATPVPAVLAIEPSRARLLAQPPAVPWLAGA